MLDRLLAVIFVFFKSKGRYFGDGMGRMPTTHSTETASQRTAVARSTAQYTAHTKQTTGPNHTMQSCLRRLTFACYDYRREEQ